MALTYFVRLSCHDCTGEDPQGCFDGGTELLDDDRGEPKIFVDVASARAAGRIATDGPPWEYEVIDEDGNEVEAL